MQVFKTNGSVPAFGVRPELRRSEKIVLVKTNTGGSLGVFQQRDFAGLPKGPMFCLSMASVTESTMNDR